MSVLLPILEDEKNETLKEEGIGEQETSVSGAHQCARHCTNAPYVLFCLFLTTILKGI